MASLSFDLRGLANAVSASNNQEAARKIRNIQDHLRHLSFDLRQLILLMRELERILLGESKDGRGTI